MAVTEITNLEFGKMVQAAASKLSKNAEFINSLNVFPVPDEMCIRDRLKPAGKQKMNITAYLNGHQNIKEGMQVVTDD